MKQKIIPHLWFDKEAKEAAALYTSILPHSSIDSVRTLKDTPSGDCDIVSFTLLNQKFMAISAGPYFKLNPSISLFITFEEEAAIDHAWNTLLEGGTALMPYDKYPWATKYGWLQDKYGLTWQLSYTQNAVQPESLAPLLMFTQHLAGKTKEALEYYTSVFKESSILTTVPYEEGEGDTPGFIKHGRFVLNGQDFLAMDSSADHKFTFNEAFSLIIECENQEEIDYYWDKLSKVPESEQCGWCKDMYGVSWQIVPTRMNEMMAHGTEEQVKRVTEAFLVMKKFDLATLEQAYQGA